MGVTEVKNGWHTSNGIIYNDHAYTTFGASMVAGFDYYFTKRLYTGLELGYSLKFIKYKDTAIFYNGNLDHTDNATSHINLSPFANNPIRAGFVF